ncbi:uncharacterized protein [Asterias amurensis]|uniref:uncharacterized protein n=1 Tax=Asterias amurensis TaxID=7602 RepID=UPI003AB7D7AF
MRLIQSVCVVDLQVPTHVYPVIHRPSTQHRNACNSRMSTHPKCCVRDLQVSTIYQSSIDHLHNIEMRAILFDEYPSKVFVSETCKCLPSLPSHPSTIYTTQKCL